MSKQSVKLWVAAAFIALVAVIGFAGFANFVNSGHPASTSQLVVLGVDGQRHEYMVELAQTPAQQETGLMFRDHMAADHGMLFIYPRVAPVAMWMRNTRIPLDMLFIDEAGVVVTIHEGARPYDETPIPSGHPVKAVLELNGGQVAQNGIQVGNKIVHPAFPQ